MLDKTLGLLAIVTLLGFMAVLMWFVPDVDLVIVLGVVLIMAGYDFWTTLFKSKNGT